MEKPVPMSITDYKTGDHVLLRMPPMTGHNTTHTRGIVLDSFFNKLQDRHFLRIKTPYWVTYLASTDEHLIEPDPFYQTPVMKAIHGRK